MTERTEWVIEENHFTLAEPRWRDAGWKHFETEAHARKILNGFVSETRRHGQRLQCPLRIIRREIREEVIMEAPMELVGVSPGRPEGE